MKIAIVLGTRPEIIKMSPVIRECEKRGLDYFILHTNQHYTYTLDRIFFKELELPLPKYNLHAGSGTHAEETGKMLIGIEKILLNEKPDVVLVLGDTNTVVAGALAASKLHIKVGHIEAGLRSFDRTMPEEINRIITDHCSDFLFTPTKISRENLLNEGICGKNVYLTGNTVVDAICQNIRISRKKNGILNRLGIDNNKYLLVTVHRQENVDNPARLNSILDGLNALHRKLGFQIIYPMHPRAVKMMKKHGMNIGKITITDPVGYIEFLHLENNAKLVLTDSGGVQEETCVLHVPCVTLRDNTERPETVEVGSNMLAGTHKYKILKYSQMMIGKNRIWKNPFGDGKAGERIINYLIEKV